MLDHANALAKAGPACIDTSGHAAVFLSPRVAGLLYSCDMHCAAVLQVNVREREVTSEHRMRFNRLIGSAPRSFQQQAQAVLETLPGRGGMHRQN